MIHLSLIKTLSFYIQYIQFNIWRFLYLLQPNSSTMHVCMCGCIASMYNINTSHSPASFGLRAFARKLCFLCPNLHPLMLFWVIITSVFHGSAYVLHQNAYFLLSDNLPSVCSLQAPKPSAALKVWQLVSDALGWQQRREKRKLISSSVADFF